MNSDDQRDANGRPACFLDRDGVVIHDVGYLDDPDRLELIAGAGDSIRRLNEADCAVVIVSNQSGVARGFFELAAVERVHERLHESLAAHGARVDAIRYCPHHPTIGDGPFTRACECRKPQPGMLLDAAGELGVALSRSLMVGDKLSDLGAAKNAGCRGALVRTGYGADHSDADIAATGCADPWVVADINVAIDRFLEFLAGQRT